MAKCPDKWKREIGSKAQSTWDFAEECCRQNRERMAREKVRMKEQNTTTPPPTDTRERPTGANE